MLKKCFLIQTSILLIILQSDCGRIPSMKTTPYIISESEVENEAKPIYSLLDKIPDHSDLQIVRAEMIKQVIRRALKAEHQVVDLRRKTIVDLHRKIGVLREDKRTYRKVVRILGVCSRLETLVDELYPDQRPFNVSVEAAYEEILTSKEPKFAERSRIKIFRQRVSTYGISVTGFVDAVRAIYGSLKDMAGLKPSPPKYNDVDGIKEMFEGFGIWPDAAKIIVAQIVLEPLPFLPISTNGTTKP